MVLVAFLYDMYEIEGVSMFENGCGSISVIASLDTMSGRGNLTRMNIHKTIFFHRCEIATSSATWLTPRNDR